MRHVMCVGRGCGHHECFTIVSTGNRKSLTQSGGVLRDVGRSGEIRPRLPYHSSNGESQMSILRQIPACGAQGIVTSVNRAWLIAGLLFMGMLLIPAYGQDGLKTMTDQSGGKIIYGVASGQTALPGAMVVILRRIHRELGDRPAIGRFFRVRGSNSVATTFTATAKNLGGKQ